MSADDPRAQDPERVLAGADDEFVVPDKDRMRRARPPETVGSLTEAYLARRGWRERVRGGELHRRWRQVVGEDLAERCEPVRLAGGILVVRARSQAWVTELTYLTAQIRDRANTVLDEPLVRDVQLVVGDLQGSDDQVP